MKHDFHLVMNYKIKNSIIALSKYLNTSLSSTIVYIIKTIFPMLTKYHNFSGEDYNGKYKFIDADSDIHIYMKEDDYRRIRKVYNDMHVFSMAIIIRWMIEEFLLGVKKFGFVRFLKIMQRYGNIEMSRVLRIKHWWKYEVFKHMSYSPGQYGRYKLTFSEDWTLLGFELLNC